MTARTPVEFTDLNHLRVGNQIAVGSGEAISVTDPTLEIAIGNIAGRSTINKFGRSTNVDIADTDIWDRANTTDDQKIWLAPTAARIHTIASDSGSDTTGGVGANQIEITYLPDWNTVQTSEIVVGNLNAGIAMANAAVIIHRMEVMPQPTSTSANVGTITATAATDATVTAQIEPGKGHTQMAIFGFSSTQTLYIGRLYGNVVGAAAGSEAVASLLFNPNPNLQSLVYLTRHTFGIRGTGTSALTINYFAPKVFEGPGILKLQVAGDAVNMDISGGVDGVLVNN